MRRTILFIYFYFFSHKDVLLCSLGWLKLVFFQPSLLTAEIISSYHYTEHNDSSRSQKEVEEARDKAGDTVGFRVRHF